MARRTQKLIQKYGAWFPGDADPLEIEFLFIHGLGYHVDKRGKYGKGLAYHVTEAMKMLWPEPDVYWHKWNHILVDEFLGGPGRTGVFGPSNSQKSSTLSRAALTLWYARPHGTTVLISSTTLDALKKRIWDYVVGYDKAARSRYPELPGSLIESKLMLLADDSGTEGRSFKNGVVGVACHKGGQWQGLAEYVGIKNEVMILICDECQFMPIGFLDSLANLESNENCYAALMGNLPDTHCPLAQACEPKNGWDSLPATNVSRVYETRWKNGRAIQLVAADSPNLDYPEGQEPFKNLIGRRYIEQCAYNYGVGTAKYNMFASGQIPDASMSATVFTKTEALRMHAKENVVWGHETVVRGYGLDAAYSGVGGDRTVGIPFIFGKDFRGQHKLWFGPMKIYEGSDDPKKMSHAEAIAEQVKIECELHAVEPQHLFYDGTGRSELTIALARAWSSKVVPLEFGGPATERPGFTGEKHLDDRNNKKAGDKKTCREMYDRFVSELWFAWAHCVRADQMRGLSDDLIQEGCQRKWELIREAKQSIEPKHEMKERGLRSPDLSDAAVCCVEGARRLGFPLGKDSIPVQKRTTVWIESLYEEQWRREAERTLEVA